MGRALRTLAARTVRVLLKLMLWTLLIALALVVPFRWLTPPTTAFVLRDALVEHKLIAARFVPIEAISPELALAVVSAEDQKFPHHHGFDFAAIRQALSEDRARTRGASTLSQQLAKNLYLWPGRSLLRKGLEAGLTVLIELTWSKRRILEVYLNVVEFGPGLYGAGAASEAFFAKPPEALTRREAALMAAVLPNPRRYSVRRPSRYVRTRARAIERGMRNLGGTRYLPWLISSADVLDPERPAHRRGRIFRGRADLRAASAAARRRGDPVRQHRRRSGLHALAAHRRRPELLLGGAQQGQAVDRARSVAPRGA